MLLVCCGDDCRQDCSRVLVAEEAAALEQVEEQAEPEEEDELEGADRGGTHQGYSRLSQVDEDEPPRRERRLPTIATAMIATRRLQNNEARDYHDFKWVPGWACSQAVVDEADRRPGRIMGMRFATTPTVAWLLLGCFLTVSKDVGSFLLASWCVTCDGVHGVYPNKLFLCFIPAVVLLLVVEFICLRYSIVPFVQSVGSVGSPSWLFPTNACGVAFFLVTSYLQSLVSFADGVTDGFWAASATMTVSCDRDNDGILRDIWDYVMKQSACPGFIQQIPFRALILISWVMSFLPLIYSLAFAMPRLSDWGKLWTIAWWPVGRGTSAELEWETMFGDVVCSGDLLHMLADNLGMASISSQSLAYPRSRVDALHSKNAVDPKIYTLLRSCMSRCMGSTVTIGLVEKCTQLHLQVSLWALARAEAAVMGRTVKGHVERQMLTSIVITAVLSCVHIRSIVDHLQWGSSVLSWRPPRTTSSEVPKDKVRSTVLVLSLAVVLVLYLGVLLLALIKVAALAFCDYSVWNISGCVDLSDLVKAREKAPWME